MAAASLTMKELLDIAIGAPDDGCINLHMLYAFLRQLMISGGVNGSYRMHWMEIDNF